MIERVNLNLNSNNEIDKVILEYIGDSKQKGAKLKAILFKAITSDNKVIETKVIPIVETESINKDEIDKMGIQF